MGQEFSVKNEKYEVTGELQSGNKVLVLKAKDWTDFSNSGYMYIKKYKHFALPRPIKEKYSTVFDFYQYLIENQDKIQIGTDQLIIELENGEKVNISIKNQNAESVLFVENQNKLQEYNKTENRSNMINTGPIVVLGLSSKNSNSLPSRSTNISNEDDVQDLVEIVRTILEKIILKNNPLSKVQLEDDNLRTLIQKLDDEFGMWQKNSFNVPDMKKKKTQDSENQIERLKKEIQEKNIEILKATITLGAFKQSFEFSVNSMKKEQKKETEEFICKIDSILSKLNTNQNIKAVTQKTKDSLLRRIDILVESLISLRKANDIQMSKKVNVDNSDIKQDGSKIFESSIEKERSPTESAIQKVSKIDF